MCEADFCAAFGHVYHDGVCVMCGGNELEPDKNWLIRANYQPIMSDNITAKPLDERIRDFLEEIRKFDEGRYRIDYTYRPPNTTGGGVVWWNGTTIIVGDK